MIMAHAKSQDDNLQEHLSCQSLPRDVRPSVRLAKHHRSGEIRFSCDGIRSEPRDVRHLFAREPTFLRGTRHCPGIILTVPIYPRALGNYQLVSIISNSFQQNIPLTVTTINHERAKPKS